MSSTIRSGSGIKYSSVAFVSAWSGEADAQISLDTARKEFAAVGSKDKTLKIFTREEGGCEHTQGDNMTIGMAYISDWFAEKLVKA